MGKRKTKRRKRSQRSQRRQKGGQSITAYVINLDERTDRWTSLQSNFQDITLERISAIKNDIGWKGCGLSHVKAVQMAKDKGLPFIFIMEDDCVPTEFFKKNIHTLQQWLQSNMEKWDVATTGNSYYGFFSNEKQSINPICSLSSLKLYETKNLATQGYFINSRVYDVFLSWKENLDSSPNVWTPIDLWPNIKTMKTISCTPFLTRQLNDFSNIEKKVRNYDTQYNKSEDIIESIPNLISC